MDDSRREATFLELMECGVKAGYLQRILWAILEKGEWSIPMAELDQHSKRYLEVTAEAETVRIRLVQVRSDLHDGPEPVLPP